MPDFIWVLKHSRLMGRQEVVQVPKERVTTQRVLFLVLVQFDSQGWRSASATARVFGFRNRCQIQFRYPFSVWHHPPSSLHEVSAPKTVVSWSCRTELRALYVRPCVVPKENQRSGECLALRS